MNLEYDDECTCDVGPFSSCPTCIKYGRDSFSDDDSLPLTKVDRPWSYSDYKQPEVSSSGSSWCYNEPIGRPRPNKILKAKWLECVTEGACLFVTTEGTLWIPLAMIANAKKTKKGKYKITVYPSFNPVYGNANHRYFSNPNKKGKKK